MRLGVVPTTARPTKRRLLDSLCTWFLAALSAAGILALGGAFSRTLDLLTHATPLFTLAGAGLLALSLRPWARSWPLAALGGVALLGGAALLWPDMAAGWSEPRARQADSPRVTVITQNLWQGNGEPGATAAAILAADADVVILQEARGGGADVVRRVARAYPYRANCLEKSHWCYMAIFSKRPIRNWTYHVANWQPPEYDRLSLIRATIQGPDGRDFEVIGTHLIHPDPKGEGEQQARQVVEAVADADPRTAILVGDFNRVPWSFAMRRIDERVTLRRRTHGLATWPHRLPTDDGGLPLPLPVLPIDQVFAGSDWRVVSTRRAIGAGSDHYGVVATLALEPNAALKP